MGEIMSGIRECPQEPGSMEVKLKSGWLKRDLAKAAARVASWPVWNAEARHHWPEGKYVGATCTVCGVSGFNHHKNGPRYCWPHYQDAMLDAEWRRAKWEADMIAEFGPYTPRPDPFRLAFPTPRPGGSDA